MLILSGCGDDMSSRRKTLPTNGEALQAQSGYVAVSLYIPPSNSYGSAANVLYNGKSYLIGSQTESDIQTAIDNHASGTYSVQIQGWIDEESGHNPNPTATYSVIHIKAIR